MKSIHIFFLFLVFGVGIRMGFLSFGETQDYSNHEKIYSFQCLQCHGKTGNGKKEDGKLLDIIQLQRLTNQAEIFDVTKEASKKKSNETLLEAIDKGVGKMEGLGPKGKKPKLTKEEVEMMLDYTRYLQNLSLPKP